jgi:RTX calcium-binding nonapeptide repeat (4 copies)
MSRRSVLLLVSLAALAAASPANAATVSESGGVLTYSAASGEANNVSFAPYGYGVKVTDKAKLTIGNGCAKVSKTTIACLAPTAGISVALGDRDDRLDASGLQVTSVTVDGGAGNDALVTGAGSDSLDGGAGADALACGAGTDAWAVDAADTVAADCEAAPSAPAPVPQPIAPITDPVTDVDPTGGADPSSPTDDDPAEDPGSADPAPNPGKGHDGSPDPDDPATADDPDADPATARDDAPANAVPPTIPAQTVAVGANGVARVAVSCPADSGGCAGTVAIVLPTAAMRTAGAHEARAKWKAPKPVTLGRAKFTAAAGTTPTIPVRLSKRGRQRILRGRRSRGRARIVVSTRSADGNVTVSSQDVTIRAARKAKRRRP